LAILIHGTMLLKIRSDWPVQLGTRHQFGPVKTSKIGIKLVKTGTVTKNGSLIVLVF